MRSILSFVKNNCLIYLIVVTVTLLATVHTTLAQSTQTYNTSGNFTVPAGVTSVTVEAWGGGGAGGGNSANNSRGGGGGAGGAYVKKVVDVVAGNTYTVNVAAAVAGTNGAGSQGNPSWFGAVGTVYAEGGAGGAAPSGGNVAGGIGSTTNSIGDVKYAGGNGAGGTATIGGAGGGGAGSTGVGGNASGTTAGIGKTIGGGNGGAGRNTENNGNPGVAAGGGGGGAYVADNTDHTGGSGAAGRVIISYTCANYSISEITATSVCASSGTSTITVNSTPNELPEGTYTVTYSRSAPAATGITEPMVVTAAGSGSFTARGFTSAGTRTITITSIGSGTGVGATPLCSSTINIATNIIVTSAIPSQPSAITGSTSVCPGSTETYSVSNVAGVSYAWQFPAGWVQTSGGNTNSVTVTVGAGSGNIQVTPSNGCGNGTATTLAVTNNAPTIQGSPGSRCGAGTGTITLSATASAGTISWYDSDDTFLSSGNTYTTPVLSTTTTYYAEATTGGCTSARIPVVAYIITPPSLTASGDGTFCSGSNINLNSTLAGADNVYWEGPNGYYSILEDPVLANATPAMSGTYIANSNALSGINLVINGDFELGNTGFGSAYTNSADLVPEGRYAVVAAPNSVHASFTNCADHSASGSLQMVVNGAIISGQNVWSQTVNVVPNTYYQFTYWVQSVVGNNPSELQLYINGVPAGGVYTAITATCNWGQFLYNWSSGSNTSALLELKNRNTVAGGNDFALDDIVFQHTCTSIASVNITVNDDVTAGSIGSSQTICRGNTPSALTSLADGTGSGEISYEWETNASGSYVTISAATTASYSLPALTTTTSYRRRTVSNSGGTTCYSGYTNVITITVNGPTANAGGPNTVCQSSSPAAITLTGASFGGGATSAGWSIVSGGGLLSSTAQTASPATVTYTPAANYSGIVTLRLTTSASPCTAISERTINVYPIATASAGTDINTCSNTGAVNITAGASAANYSAVQWTSNGTGTFTNATSLTLATYTPSAADIAAGSRTLTLTATGNSPCGNAVSAKTLTITTLPSATISYAGSPFCQSISTGQAVTRTGTTGGTYSASPSGLSINGTTGAIIPSTSTAGTYTVTYTMAATGGCTAQVATATVTITALPSATISYAGSPYCTSLSGAQPVTRTGTTGGNYTASPSGLSIDANTGAITPSASTPQTYTVSYTMAAAGGCTAQTANTTVIINPDGSWTGAVDQDWNNPGNWTCNQLPNINTNVLIANGKPRYPILSSGAAGLANHLTIENNASVTVTGNILQIAGVISNTGIFNATSGTIEMKGASPQNIAAGVFSTNTIMNLSINNAQGVALQGSLNLTGVLRPITGNFNAAGYLTLISTPIQTALVEGAGTGTITGEVTMQRYLPSAFGYKYISSPFQSATVAELATEVNLSASFPSFYKYDENHYIDSASIKAYQSGWTKYTTSTNSLVPLEGYAANLGNNNNPITMSMSGVVNSGPLTLTLYNHHRKYTKGFNLVGNPYPSPIDWDAAGWTKTNIDNAVYFFNAGNTDQYTGVYTSYVNGIPSGNANNVIGAMQGFFVHVSDGTYPVTATLGVSNSVRINNLNPIFKSAVIDTRAVVHLTAGFDNKDAIEDAAVIYFQDHATKGFDQDKDALKLNNTDILVPNLYTLTPDGKELSINGMPAVSDSITTIPLGITTYTSGWIVFKAEDIRDLSSYEQVLLQDIQAGKTFDLRQSSTVRLYLDKGQYNRRFNLVISKVPDYGNNSLMERLFTLTRSVNTVLVKVTLADEAQGSLIVSNIMGQVLMRKEVFDREIIEINQDISTGVYVITLISGKRTESEKILMRKDYE